MPPPQVRKVGAYAKLLANYAADDAIMEAGEAAELLFVRALAFCATSDSDGFISEQQLIRYVGSGMRDAKKRAERLVSVGVWERTEGGFQVRSWTKIHDTAEEKGRRLRADRERKRAERGQPDGIPAAVQSESEPRPSGQTSDKVSDSLSLTQHSTTEHTQDTDTDAATSGRPTASQLAAAFDEFWKAYPKKVAKDAARRRFEQIIKRGVDPSELLAGAKQYATEVRGTEVRFIKQPDGWLNAGRWQDELPAAAGEAIPWWRRK